MRIFEGLRPLEKGVNASWERNAVILDNIANVDTPNFKTSEVQFESLYKNALEGDDFQLKRTRPTHMYIGDSSLSGVDAIVVKREDTTERMDGSNVDIDREMTDYAKNYIFYNTLLNKVNGQFNQLRAAIKG